MIYVDGTFYWYGENKEKSFSEYKIWHWGVRLYSSKDLYNWKDEGIIINVVFFGRMKRDSEWINFMKIERKVNNLSKEVDIR